MNWNRVRWLFVRELRDQIRDRRTMFTILVLPLMLYPIMGLLMLQVAQLRTTRHLSLAVFGSENLPADFLPPAADDTAQTVDEAIVSAESRDPQGNKITWHFLSQMPDSADAAPPNVASAPGVANSLEKSATRSWLRQSDFDAALYVSATENNTVEDNPQFQIVANLATDNSQLAASHVHSLIDNWQQQSLRKKLQASQIDLQVLEPANVETLDISEDQSKQVMLWAKVLPLIMFVWALTGAFYPAIDLCAGEKERGTLETLLSGPATRREIVYGKLFAVICFSLMTAILNLLSMQITISVVAGQFAGVQPEYAVLMGPLPLHSIGWLLVLLLPISILFSAVALAIAALARSSKEGQYYLMPLLLVGLPMVMLPMLPGVHLSIGTSMFPVAGAILLSRSLVEGNYAEALLYSPLVILITGISCWLATRWAIRQFETDTVLFRETDRFDMAAWLQHLWRDRSSVASPMMAMVCGAIVLVALFYGRLQSAGGELTWENIARSTIAVQLAMILAPCLIMAIFLTTSIRKALRLHRVSPLDFAVAMVLAISLHPSYVYFAQSIQAEFPFGEETKAALSGIDALLGAAPLVSLLMVLAVIPAICEELAFRGFIFAGLASHRGTVRAIFVTSVLFGLSHGVLQQSISASAMGLVLGIVAWRTGSVVCCILIHVCHNSLSMILVRLGTIFAEPPAILQPFVRLGSDMGFEYTGNWHAISAVLTIAAMAYFVRSPAKTVTRARFAKVTDSNPASSVAANAV